VALGLSDVAGAVGGGAQAAAMILKDGAEIGMAEGLWLRRAKVMDRHRIEVVGAGAARSALVALGCFTEIIAYTARVFVPADRPAVLDAVLARWPAQSILAKAA
jgi:hypothetical protein